MFSVVLRLVYVLPAVSSFVTSYTVDEELAALQEGMEIYAALHGMNLTTYHVATSDGWLLGVHRLQSMKIYDRNLSPPVLLCHGFGASSFDYISNRRNESLGFLLADQGYDTWMVNFRANRFSNRKVDRNGNTSDPSAEDYLRVSFQYMAERDVPAVLEKILEVTQQKKLYVVAFSMGGTSMYAFLADNHDYDDKILHYAALAPVVKVGSDCSALLRALFAIAPTIPNVLFAKFMFTKVFGRQILATALQPDFDPASSLECQYLPSFCKGIMEAIISLESSSDAHRRTAARNSLRRSLIPSGLTLMTAYHYSQEYARPSWTKLDYRYIPQSGIRNVDEYGRQDPPVYNFNDVRVNYSVFFTTRDMFTGVRTAMRVIDDLRIDPENYRIVKDLTHLDVVWGWDSRCFVYDDVVDRFNRIETTRGRERVEYRKRAAKYVESLKLENSCGPRDHS